MNMTDLLNSSDGGGYSTNPSRPDYACPAYVEMAPRWSIVNDLRDGTVAIRAKKEKYLPKFEAETPKDWDARVAMSFVEDHYATTLAEHVGMVMAEPISLGEDVPPALVELCEDIDGEGNHLDVFAQAAFDAALHYGHCVLFTDYPVADNIKTKRDQKVARVRPYVQLYKAPDVLCAEYVTVGGVRVLVRIMLRETTTETEGEFGLKPSIRYREIRQAVFYDEFTGRARGLGAITWRLWKATGEKDASGVQEFEEVGTGGTIVGPEHIAARVVYGGEKMGPMHTAPHLYGLALLNVEETQVKSDYASVMHKCNVPTPVFIGRNTSDTTATVQMGHGIDIPVGGDAKMLEPSGTALAATRTRLADIKASMQRHGASTAEGEGGKTMTATEAAQYAKARNAKLRKAARSLQDALEGVLADMAAFMGIAGTNLVKSGGSVAVTQDFSGQTIDPAYLSVLVSVYEKDGLTLPELRYVVQTGQLPEDFDPNDKMIIEQLMANAEARGAQAELERQARLDALGVAA